MTISSFVQQGHSNQGYLDSGPYSADEWASWLSSLFVTQPTLGAVKAGFENELLVTNLLAQTFTVDTGAAMVNGRPFLVLDDAVKFDVPTPGANPRIDIVGLCLNNTAIARTVGIASGNSFAFPAVLTDYGGVAEIPPFTVRPVVLLGSEAASPSAPTLDTDPDTLFMIPLYQYQISTGGVVSGSLDLRRYDALSASTLIYKFTGEGGNINKTVSIPQNYTNLKIVYETVMNDISTHQCFVRFLLNTGLGAYSPNAYYGVTSAGASSTGLTAGSGIRPYQQNMAFVSGELTLFNYSRVTGRHGYHAVMSQDRFIAPATDIRNSSFGGNWVPAAPTAITDILIEIGSDSGGGLSNTDLEYTAVSIYGLH